MAVKIEGVLRKVRGQLYDTGMETLSGLREAFRHFDEESSATLPDHLFLRAISQAGVFLTVHEQTELFRTYGDRSRGVHPSNHVPIEICLASFVEALLGTLEEDRTARAHEVWDHLSGGASEVALVDVQAAFRADDHPRVVTKEITAADAVQRLGALPATITREVFLAYVRELGCCAPKFKGELFTYLLDCFDAEATASVPLERLEQLEIFLTEKIRQYTAGGIDGLRATLRKYFHLQDSQGNGGLGYAEFVKFLQVVGMNLSEFESRAFFDYLAADCGGGRLGFEFLCLRVQAINAGPGPTKYLAGAPPASLVDKVKSHLLKHHPKGVQSLFLAFRHIDREQKQWVTHGDFYAALRQCGLRLGSQEVERLLNYFDANKTAKVTYKRFLHAIRGEVNEARVGLIDRAWAAVAGDAREMDAAALRSIFEPSMHPRVYNNFQTAGSKTDDMLEFMGEELMLGKVSRSSFTEYFMDESCQIPEDCYFERYMLHAFRLDARGG